MSLGAFLLRLCLCLGLLVNGSAQALAAAHSVVAHHQARVAAAACHESSDGKASDVHMSSHHAATGTADKPECCKAGVCDCACSHGAFATLPAGDAGGKRIGPTTKLNVLSARYASPALPRLIRPPIL